MEDEYLKECIQKENTIRLYTACVQKDRLRWHIEVVTVQYWLDHNERLCQILSH
jgi:hypothetical protein